MSSDLNFILQKDTDTFDLDIFHDNFPTQGVQSKELIKSLFEGNWNGLGLNYTRLYWGAFNHNIFTKVIMPKSHVTIITLLSSDGEVIFNNQNINIGDMLMLGEGAECKIKSSCDTKWVFFLIKRKDLKKLGDIEIVKRSQDILLTQIFPNSLLYQINNLLKMLTVMYGTMFNTLEMEVLYRNISALLIYPIVKFYAIDVSSNANQKQLTSKIRTTIDKYMNEL